jgi:hypothetical protein
MIHRILQTTPLRDLDGLGCPLLHESIVVLNNMSRELALDALQAMRSQEYSCVQRIIGWLSTLEKCIELDDIRRLCQEGIRDVGEMILDLQTLATKNFDSRNLASLREDLLRLRAAGDITFFNVAVTQSETALS